MIHSRGKALALFLGLMMGASAPTLAQDCLSFEQALKLNETLDPAIGEALANSAQAEARLKQVKADWKPQVSAFGRTTDGPLGVGDAQTNNQFGLVLSQRIYDFGQGKYQKEAAESRLLASGFTLDQTKNSSAVEVAQIYLLVMRSKERVESAKVHKGYLESLIGEVDTRLSSNLITLAEKNSIKAEYALTTSNLIEEELELSAALAELAVLTGETMSTCSALSSFDSFLEAKLPPTMVDAVNVAISRNPELSVAKAESSAILADFEATKRSRLPILNLQAITAFTNNDFVGDFDNQNRVGLEVNTPILGFGRYSGAEEEAAGRYTASQLTLDRQRRDIEKTITQAWQKSIAYERLALSQADMRDSLKAEAEALNREFENNLRPFQDILRAEADVQSAELREIDARYSSRQEKLEIAFFTDSLKVTR